MAILNSTSPGQLGKYVIPTVNKLNLAMKKGTPLSRGSAKSYRIKNTQANINVINEFSRIGSDPKQQKAALALELETVDTKQKVIKIGTNMDDPWLGYYHWIVAKNQDNPFVPKIYSHREFGDYYITIMERLEPSTLIDEVSSIRDHIVEGNINKKELFDDFVGHGYNDRDCKYIVDLCEAIVNHTDAFTTDDEESYQWEDNWQEFTKIDLHDGNFMERGDGTIVITDPWCNVDMTDIVSVEDWVETHGKINY